MNGEQQPINVIQQPSDHAFFVGLLEHDDFLERYEHFLRGEVLITKPSKDGKSITEQWLQKYPALMNSYGVSAVMSFLRPICESKIIAITEFDDEFIDKLAYDNIRALTKLLVENFFYFEFPSVAALELVNVQGINIISAQLRRAKGGSTLDAITTQTQVTEQRQVQQEPKQGIMSRLPFFGKKEPQFRV